MGLSRKSSGGIISEVRDEFSGKSSDESSGEFSTLASLSISSASSSSNLGCGLIPASKLAKSWSNCSQISCSREISVSGSRGGGTKRLSSEGAGM